MVSSHHSYRLMAISSAITSPGMTTKSAPKYLQAMGALLRPCIRASHRTKRTRRLRTEVWSLPRNGRRCGIAVIIVPFRSLETDAKSFAPVTPLRRCHPRFDGRAAFAEADAGEARSLAVAAEDDLVAILEKPALLAGRQRDWLPAAFAQLQEARPAVRLRARHRARAHQVANFEIAAAARV